MDIATAPKIRLPVAHHARTSDDERAGPRRAIPDGMRSISDCSTYLNVDLSSNVTA
jgi:hypothetical protein